MSVIDLTSEHNLAQGPHLHTKHLNSSYGDHTRLLRAPNAHIETKLILDLVPAGASRMRQHLRRPQHPLWYLFVLPRFQPDISPEEEAMGMTRYAREHNAVKPTTATHT